ncbi:iron complex transport system ATP-binding protein [Alkalithermobacter thermoalcaliphilus JW-YL-7 = DSM 7308]|uniref:Iron complex transport system ATP-binding protein n=1 Tax=Alkalithermobacter thermoalcaliphilus JW-YL-7 = DSM 7308 TaxID=1121328 RepID=A0A150FST8_CLOPD|nr:Iron-chelate-transporting ATPase [[Clostridium] paradoxum JW-YL-7 = DSM 7308]SHL17819.1 iron complex transport system ATP-binding protein [[Clostridium] paradoxum JW-YL-7 = DSM 7308]
MITFENVSLSYGKKEILNNLNFSITKGKITSILGPNGCGKTTLLSSFQGNVDIKGKIYINGIDIKKYKFKDLAKIISFVPQTYPISFPYLVKDMILSGRTAHIKNIPTRKDEDIAKQYINMLNLSDIENVPYTQISGGQRQLVFIARALCQETDIIILDEPTSYLDIKNQILVMSIIKKLQKKLNKTFIMTLHDPNLALSYSDEALMFQEQTIIKGISKEIINPLNIKKSYGINAQKIEIDKITFLYYKP